MKSQNDPPAGRPECDREIMARLLRMSPEPQKDVATRIMERMVRMPPEQHKDAPKPTTAQAEAQRRRREKERKEWPASKGRVHKGKSRA
jgi:hypothetical protein